MSASPAIADFSTPTNFTVREVESTPHFCEVHLLRNEKRTTSHHMNGASR
jgi:hypothetical protein